MKVVVVDPASLHGWSFSGKWVYADGDPGPYARIRTGPGGTRPSLTTPAGFQAEAASLRASFVRWTDANLAGRPCVAWICSPLCRNPFESDLFLHCVWLRIIARALSNAGGDIAVVTASPGLARSIQRLCLERRVEFAHVGRLRMRLRRQRAVARTVAGTAARAAVLVYRMLLARLVLGDAYRKRLTGIQLLLGTYLHDADLADDGTFRDRYLPGLSEWYERHGVESACYPSLHGIRIRRLSSLYRRMRASSTRFTPHELFVTPGDLCTAAWRCARWLVSSPKAVTRWENLDVQPLVDDERFRAAIGRVLAVLLTEVPSRLEQSGIRPRWYVSWYENQAIDKANTIGFGRLPLPCRTIGVRQYPVTPGYLSLYSTAEEVRAGVAPAEQWVCGRAPRALFGVYDSITRYEIVPALRYAHLYEATEHPTDGRSLAVPLAFSIRESLRILELLIEAVSAVRPVFDEIWIRPHGDIGAERMRAAVAAKWPGVSELRWHGGPFADLLSRARVVVSTATGAALEAICRGIPVVIVGQTAGIDLNPLEPVDGRMWRVVYDADGLKRSLVEWGSGHPVPPAERLALGAAIRAEHFERTTAESMRSFVSLLDGHA